MASDRSVTSLRPTSWSSSHTWDPSRFCFRPLLDLQIHLNCLKVNVRQTEETLFFARRAAGLSFSFLREDFTISPVT